MVLWLQDEYVPLPVRQISVLQSIPVVPNINVMLPQFDSAVNSNLLMKHGIN